MPQKPHNDRLDDLFADLANNLPEAEGDTKPNRVRSPDYQKNKPVAIPDSQIKSGRPVTKTKSHSSGGEYLKQAGPPKYLGKKVAQHILKKFPKSSDPTPRLSILVSELGKILGAQTVTALLFNHINTTQRIVAEYASFEDVIPGIGMEIPLNAISDLLLKGREVIAIHNGIIRPETQAIYQTMQAQGIQNRAIFPITRNGGVIGSLTIDLIHSGQYFSSGDIEAIKYLIDKALNSW
jgi:hypothetical protein